MKANLKIEAIDYGSRQVQKIWGRIVDEAMPGTRFGSGLVMKPRNWVAEIIGKNQKYGLERVFLKGKVDWSKANSKATRGVYLNYMLESGRIYDVSKPTSWRSTERFFVTVDHEGNINRHESYEDAKKTIG